MKTIRILHIYRTYFPETQGGGQEAIRQFALATKALAVENTIFALARNPDPAVMNLPEGQLIRAKSWFEVASCDFGGVSALQRCRAVADECDIIQIHYPWPFADMLLPFIRRKKQPLIVTYVSDIVRQKGLGQAYAPLRRYLLNSADRIVASSPNYAESSEVLQDYRHKLECIPHCLEDVPNVEKSRKNHWETRLGSDFFLFVGVLRYYKGLEFLIAAARQVSAPIVIIGDGPEGKKLRAMVLQTGLAHVHFLGALQDDDKNALYELCRAVVFPSHLRSEAFGITLLEGARAGKPLISCEIGTGTTWINRHEETGLVVQPADSGSLALAMNRLSGDDDLCRVLGLGARARWESHFTHEVVGAEYRRLYDELLA